VVSPLHIIVSTCFTNVKDVEDLFDTMLIIYGLC